MKPNKQPIYIDLFEDGLFVDSQGSNLRERYNELLNSLRFHCAIAILFDQPLVIPEPWMVSSPIFLRLSTEILKSYSPIYDPGNITSRIHSIPFPFIFGLFGNYHIHPINSYLISLRNRLADGRAILLSPAFGKIGETISYESQQLRKKIVQDIDFFIDLSREKIDTIKIDDLTKKISDSLFTAGYEEDGLNISRDMSIFMNSINNNPFSRDLFFQSNTGLLKKAFTETEIKIRSIINGNDAENYISEDIIIQYRNMFKKIPFEQEGTTLVQKYLRYIKSENLSPDAMNVIWATGRFALHRAYAACLSSRASTVTSSYHLPNNSSNDACKAVYNLIGLVGPWEGNISSDNVEGIMSIPTLKYDLADTLDWDLTWQEIYKISINTEWINFREKLIEEIKRNNSSEKDIKYWEELFDYINDKIQTISLGRSGYRLMVFKKLISGIGEDIADNAAKIAAYNNGNTAQAHPEFGIALRGLKMLVDATSYFDGHKYFTAVRFGRKAKLKINRILGK